MKRLILFAVLLFAESVADAQSRKAGEGQRDFLVVTTDTAKKKTSALASTRKPADSLAVSNKTLRQKPLVKKN
ncbi:hypothetical protein [Niabella sp.]|uniref:hypothetical protein n=1 Tax=Niabella sp. TaxID=1962976 RepID=UPI002616546B|nr:hypothetical protein [Niabella sp.]